MVLPVPWWIRERARPARLFLITTITTTVSAVGTGRRGYWALSWS